MRVGMLTAVFLFAVMPAGCSSFHEVGKGANEVGTTVKDDFRNIGPTMKKGFGQVGRDARDAAEEAKNPFK
jgi:hypothetical protein